MSKSHDIIRYKRGQVWMRKVPNTWEHSEINDSSVQYNNRPCLIISNDYGNMSSSIVTVVKITSVDKGTLEINVNFTNDKEEVNTILCNQIETISKGELSYYMFTLSDDIMERVEKALLKAQGIA